MSNVGNIYSQQASYSYSASLSVKTSTTTKSDAKAEEAAATAATPEDTVEITGNQPQTDSSKQIYKPDLEKVDYLKSVMEKNAQTLRDMAQRMLGDQGLSGAGFFSEGWKPWESGAGNASSMMSQFEASFNMSFSMSSSFTVTDDMRAEANALIGEDGPLGVKAVSQNILDFAKAITGGDPSKIDAMQKAVQKAFDEVSEMFGGFDKLPSVTQKTYDAVIKGFDDWRASAAKPATPETPAPEEKPDPSNPVPPESAK